jgi:hypothetical protein
MSNKNLSHRAYDLWGFFIFCIIMIIILIIIFIFFDKLRFILFLSQMLIYLAIALAYVYDFFTLWKVRTELRFRGYTEIGFQDTRLLLKAIDVDKTGMSRASDLLALARDLPERDYLAVTAFWNNENQIKSLTKAIRFLKKMQLKRNMSNNEAIIIVDNLFSSENLDMQ